MLFETSMQRNAIILAAGTSSRFLPLSLEVPKGLLEVKGEVLIERQIRQLHEAGVTDICIVTGYKAEMFSYLCNKYGVEIVLNEDYAKYNNTSSLIRVADRLSNTFICSSDNYFLENVFIPNSENSYYSACYTQGKTSEYCLYVDNNDMIRNVVVGGENAWYMIGQAFFNDDFSRKFKSILTSEYNDETVRHQYWEDVYIKHINSLPPIKINRYTDGQIVEFDSLDELRAFDHTYINDTRSSILKEIGRKLNCRESSLKGFSRIPNADGYLRFTFQKDDETFLYDNGIIRKEA